MTWHVSCWSLPTTTCSFPVICVCLNTHKYESIPHDILYKNEHDMCTDRIPQRDTSHTQNDDAFHMSTDFIQFALNFSCSVLCYVTILQNIVTYFSHVFFKDATHNHHTTWNVLHFYFELFSGIEDANSDICVCTKHTSLRFQCTYFACKSMQSFSSWR